MNQMKEFINKLTTAQKIQAAIAAVATLFLMVAVPVYAWLSYTSKIETMTKVQEPPSLDLCAGDGDTVEYFELSNIDLENIQKTGKPQCYVFGVITGNSKTYYDIQLAHTTNIPFTYTLYRAEEALASDTDIVTYESPVGDKTVNYKRTIESGKTVAEPLDLVDLNPDEDNEDYYGRVLGLKGDDFYDLVYDGNDKPEIYAVPIYSQVQELETRDVNHDFYILEIGWASESSSTNFTKWNAASNNKETDIIYITASRTTE